MDFEQGAVHTAVVARQSAKHVVSAVIEAGDVGPAVRNDHIAFNAGVRVNHEHVAGRPKQPAVGREVETVDVATYQPNALRLAGLGVDGVQRCVCSQIVRAVENPVRRKRNRTDGRCNAK